MIAPWLVALIVSTALNVAAYVITPKPKAPKPEAIQQADSPTAEADKPMPVLFGTGRISETNVIGWWDKSTAQREIKV